MDYINKANTYIKSFLPAQDSSIFNSKTSSLVNEYFSSKKPKKEVFTYLDKTQSGKLISSTKVKHTYPVPSNKTYQHHKSLEDLCTHIALTRNPNAGKKLAAEASSASFSSRNRGDISTEVRICKGLKKILGIDSWPEHKIKDFFNIESLYKKNSEFNGHSFSNKFGKVIEINSASTSSADRKALPVQNLTVVKSSGENLLYTGRPDTKEKAKEQALFILSHKLNVPLLEEADPTSKPSSEMPKWLKGKKGVTWNETSQTLELPYVVYSIMSDSTVQSAFYKKMNDPFSNEKLFIETERKTLNSLKKEPFLVKDSTGKVFKLQCKPIFLSQSFNSFDLMKGFVGEGSLSPAITSQGWKELSNILKENPKKAEKLHDHIATLNKYFKGDQHLSNLHLFLHMNIILQELNSENEDLPTVLHCKSSTDRTGIGAALLATLKQFERLGIPLPSDMNVLTSDIRFKELFHINWIPTWHQRSKLSRDIEGISFGKGLGQNPILLDILPERFLQRKKGSMSGRIKSSFFAAANALGYEFYRAFHLNTCSLKNKEMTTEKHGEKMAVLAHSNCQRKTPCHLPTVYLNERIHNFRSKTGSPLSPLQKEKQIWRIN
jgi:hypothetical protein